MTLDETIEKLQNIRKEAKNGTVEVYFDTEASTFNCHIVPLYNVHYLENEVVSEKDYVIFTTQFHHS